MQEGRAAVQGTKKPMDSLVSLSKYVDTLRRLTALAPGVQGINYFVATDDVEAEKIMRSSFEDGESPTQIRTQIGTFGASGDSSYLQVLKTQGLKLVRNYVLPHSCCVNCLSVQRSNLARCVHFLLSVGKKRARYILLQAGCLHTLRPHGLGAR